jgi:hypothetical protein
LSCRKKQRETLIYQNDFETNDLAKIERGLIDVFFYSSGTNLQTKVLGRYNNGSFVLRLNDLPTHEMIRISFDLNTHDTWDGNQTGGGADGPDTWQMNIDGKPEIYTTFSNSTYIQSYPGTYPSFNQPKNYGVKDMPGACIWINENVGTTRYKIEKFIPHNSNTFVLECLDRLVQTNSPTPMCDESWSIDNITITAVSM